MADELKVDPVALHNGSDDMLNSVGEAALSFVSHEDGLAEAAPGWIGSSQQALGELAARWEARHGHHKLAGWQVGDACGRRDGPLRHQRGQLDSGCQVGRGVRGS